VPFEVRPVRVDGVLVLRVHGELDLVTAPVLEAAVTTALAESPAALVLDLTPTTFLDSSGARQVARAARQAGRESSQLQVVCPKDNRTVRLVIDMLELRTLVPVLDSSDEIGVPPSP
jgi:anti-sigma B factor antagonist